MARLFFAVWPDAAGAARLARLALDVAAVSGGKAVPRGKIHLTLAFLGEVPEARMEAARAAGGAVRFERFAFVLDRVGAFRGARVAWAGSAQTPAPLAALQSDLAARLRDAGFGIEERPFAPHATLARRTRRIVPPASIEPIAWPVGAFTLVRSVTGTGRYEVMEEFPAR
jgi:2'-5' RNA ligase